jgi:hypothetical protein
VSALHEVVWQFEAGALVRGKVVCNAPEGSECRLVCDEDCELYSDVSRDDSGLWTHLAWAEDDDGNEVEVRHPMNDQGDCNAAMFINDSDLEECCPDDFEVARTPVSVRWNGDYYEWSPEGSRS